MKKYRLVKGNWFDVLQSHDTETGEIVNCDYVNKRTGEIITNEYED